MLLLCTIQILWEYIMSYQNLSHKEKRVMNYPKQCNHALRMYYGYHHLENLTHQALVVPKHQL
ncbi:hypothetical protein D3C85_1794230 [compost metagenome]